MQLRNALTQVGSNLQRLLARYGFGNRRSGGPPGDGLDGLLLAESTELMSGDPVLARLIEKLDVTTESAELFFTLGDAFRRNGEYARAVAVHEQMLSKLAPESDVRHRATLALATDYSVAGMLDRAEAILSTTLERKPQDPACRVQLLRLYEKQRDWQRAIDLTASGLIPGDLAIDELNAQYHCELAEEAETEGRRESAMIELNEALGCENQCGRALLHLCRLAINDQQHARALELFYRIERYQPELAPEIADEIFRVLRQSGERQLLLDHLGYIKGRQNSYTVIKLARDAIAEIEGEQVAERFFLEQVARRPSLKALHDWALRELALTQSREKDKIAAIVQMLGNVVDTKPVYRCEHCGYRCNELQWRCPGCESWKSVKVIIGAEGE